MDKVYLDEVEQEGEEVAEDMGVEEEDAAIDADDYDQQHGGGTGAATWTIWFDSSLVKGLQLEEYRKRIQQVGTVTTTGDLQRYPTYHNFEFVPEDEAMLTKVTPKSPFRFNLRLFRHGVQPFWEDRANGLIFTLTIAKEIPPLQYQLFWKALAQSILTQRIFPCNQLVEGSAGEDRPVFNTHGLNGIVVHYGRNKGHGAVEVWCSEPGPVSDHIINCVQQIIPPSKYQYKLTTKTLDSCITDNDIIRQCYLPNGMPSAKFRDGPHLQGGIGVDKDGTKVYVRPQDAIPEAPKPKKELVFEKSEIGVHRKDRYSPYETTLERAFAEASKNLTTYAEKEQLLQEMMKDQERLRSRFKNGGDSDEDQPTDDRRAPIRGGGRRAGGRLTFERPSRTRDPERMEQRELFTDESRSRVQQTRTVEGKRVFERVSR